MANITYIVTSDVANMGWTAEELANELRAPLAALGVEVVCKPHQSNGGGLIDASDAVWDEAETLRAKVEAIVERIVCA